MMIDNSPSLFSKRAEYKPFWYPWAYEAFVASEQMHWLVREVPMTQDVKTWRADLTDRERHLLTHIFRFFTQADVDVASGYIDRYLPTFKPTEIRMAMASIAAREGVHIQAYSTLIDELGIPEVEYSAFMGYKEMLDKHEYLFQRRDGLEGLALDIAVFSAFGEGLQLFSSFIMLLNFTRFGKMTGMGQVVSWSIRDETLHVEFMMKVYHQLLAEHPRLRTAAHSERIREIAQKMVELEFAFIDLAYETGENQGLSAEDVKQYIRYTADQRLAQLGERALFGVSKNPLGWVDAIVFGKEHTNFFENRATDYSKGAVTGSWDDAFG
ncbi:ribonucleotide-diphosphate reductase subunit beta [Xanthomonas phage FMYAK-P1]|uniref:ribonucleoside-diphosphate reductase n=1 Tax=Xanthomonas phage FMYAK-P1 TaxID=2886031 RepID=A0AAE8YNB5_9CAUD|nr:ribonucleotide-diphosphate reductase subunit beta [Xanthomonas phage FMYAK-P1]UGL62719.1 ribonucleotide-diphosphate reductase subunit beta [Xanthomonas phage FMYAK-P1]